MAGKSWNRLMTQGLTAARVALWPPNNQALPVIRKEYRQESQQRQEGADFINQIDAGMVRQQA